MTKWLLTRQSVSAGNRGQGVQTTMSQNLYEFWLRSFGLTVIEICVLILGRGRTMLSAENLVSNGRNAMVVEQ
jgi:hypothetical protein